MITLLEEVKISYNKQTWSKEGTYYRGCFTMSQSLFEKFQSYIQAYMKKYENKRLLSSHELQEIAYLPNWNINKDTLYGRDCVFLKLTQRAKLVDFLKEEGVTFDLNRALGGFNYYIELK